MVSEEYISREAANKAVCEICDICEGTFCAPCNGNPLAAIPTADVIERPRWIPVTERLPEICEYVLCTCRAGIVDVFKYVNGINGPWYKDSRHVYMKGFVTHWQPLPEPPKEEA